MLVAGGALLAACSKEPEKKPSVEQVRYGDDPSQYGELHLPASGERLPVAVVLHGGFWRSEYGLSLATPLARDLAGLGWAAYALEYRRVGNGGGWPATFEDVAAGIDALGNASPRLDLDRVVAVGHSAGGHLAVWAAAQAGLPDGAPGATPAVKLAGAVSQAGVVDLVGAGGDNIGGPVADLLGAAPGQDKSRYRLASPYERLPLHVPVTLVHGTRDQVVPIAQSRRYAEAARRAGDTVTLVPLDGVGHFELIDPGHAAWQTCREQLSRLPG